MANYTKLTDFASKDSLATGNALKVIKGTEIDDEFEAIETAISTKANTANPVFTGVPTAPTAISTTNSTQIATTAYVTTAVTTLDTDLQSQINTKAEQAITITAGSGLTGGGTLAANRTISHADTSSQASVNNSGNTFIQDITLDTYGHVTGLSSATVVPLSLSQVYPVGSVYINAGVSTNPSTLFGFGTWVAFGSGRVLVGVDTGDASFNTLGETGGSKNAVVVSHTHSFSGTTSTKSLTGTFKTDDQSWGTGVFSRSTLNENSSTGSECCASVITMNASHNHTFSGTTGSTGSSGTNANLQPYITVYMWKRTA